MDIVVTGRNRKLAGGLMIVQRQPETTNSISAEAIAQKMTLSGPYQLVATMPGVNTGQSDPYQMTPRYGLYIRGLPMNEIGWVADGAPQLDQAYNLPYSETWADNENIAGVTILPGSTRIVDPVQTAVAGEFSMTIRDPSDEAGGRASYSYGSFNSHRIFGGIDTGEIGQTGLKAFGTISYTRAGAFALPDEAHGTRLHTDFKAVKDWGGDAKSSLWVSFNNWDSLRSQPFTLAQFRANQQSGDYSVGNYASIFNPLSNSNSWYKHAFYTRKDVRIVSNNQFSPADGLKVTLIPYYRWIHSNSQGPSSINPNNVFSGNQRQTVSTTGLFLLPNGNIPVKTNLLQKQTAYGFNSYATYELSDSNELQVGWWHDHWKMDQLNNFTPVAVNGDAANWGGNALLGSNGQQIRGSDFSFRSNVDVLSIQDSQKFFDDKLTFEVGAKYFMGRLNGTNRVPGTQTDMRDRYKKFLPRGTVSFDINSNMQVYANIVSEIRVPVPITTYPDTYSISNGTLSQIGLSTLKPEDSLGEEIGYRYHDGLITADVALFNKKLKNHTVVSLAFLNGAGVNTAINAGGLLMRGATAELSLSPIHGFSPYVNAQYLDTETTSNLQVGSDFLPTKGLDGVNAPKFTATVGINYDQGPFFANVLFRHTGSQYSTFMNDQKLEGYETVDLGFGYRLPEGMVGKNTVFRLAVTNVGNKPYLSTFSSVTPTATTRTGINGTTIAGRAPSYWLGSPRSIMGTISTQF
ncbi:TonB-dependent receptor [Sphingobium arseniciresistens]|uniref:TonB-dependent receptor n=1 Tax=Sphingobium arseniciresistens TaxID=3030834 RepID=UPI0023B8DEF5